MSQPVLELAPPPAPRTPGIATTAAVLGFVDAASVLGLVVLVLADTAAAGTGEVGIGIGLGAALALGLAAALLLGSLALVRGTGRAVLVGATITQIALSVALAVLVLLGLGTALDPYGLLLSARAFVVAALVIGLATPVVRLVLLGQRSVGTWLAARRAPAPVWSAPHGQWLPAPAPQRSPGTTLGVLAPVGALAVATVIVLGTAPDTAADYVDTSGWFAYDPNLGTDPYTDPYADPYASGPVYEVPLEPDTTQYADRYDGGTPVPPPTSDDPDYDPTLDALAQSCFDGAIGSCDDLYYATAGGTLYEWLGSTCGGRLDGLAYGSCIYVPLDQD